MQVRAHVEAQIALIAAGKADKAAVVEHTLQQFVQKFLFFSENISRMDVLFEANFAPLTASGSSLWCIRDTCRFTCCAKGVHVWYQAVLHATRSMLGGLRVLVRLSVTNCEIGRLASRHQGS